MIKLGSKGKGLNKPMQSKGFTLIELLVVIIILGILATVIAPKYINFKDNAQTTTLQAIKESIEGGAAMVYGKSVVKGNHKEALDVVNVNNAAINLVYGYPSGDDTQWINMIALDTSEFNVIGTANDSRFIIYPNHLAAPSGIGDACIVYYEVASYNAVTKIHTPPNIGLNPC